MGTGMVRAAHSSHFQIWMSVPQIAVLRMRMSRSLCPMAGLGTSTISSPTTGCILAKALMNAPAPARFALACGHLAGSRGGATRLANDAQIAPHTGEGLNGPIDVLWRMGGAHLGTNAGAPLGNHRIGETDHIDALRQQGLGHAA